MRRARERKRKYDYELSRGSCSRRAVQCTSLPGYDSAYDRGVISAGESQNESRIRLSSSTDFASTYMYDTNAAVTCTILPRLEVEEARKTMCKQGLTASIVYVRVVTNVSGIQLVSSRLLACLLKTLAAKRESLRAVPRATSSPCR